MSSELIVDELTGRASAGSIAVTAEGGTVTTNLQQGLAKHWIKFDSSDGSPAILDSLNSSSITDTAAARYGLVIASDFASKNFSMTGTGSNTYGDGQGKTIVHDHEQTDTASLSNVCIKYGGQANGEDRDDISATHHGDLA